MRKPILKLKKQEDSYVWRKLKVIFSIILNFFKFILKTFTNLADLALLESPEEAEVVPPKISKPSPPKTTRLRARPKKPDTIDLTSCVPVTMGFVNLDSDGDEDCNKSYLPVEKELSDLSFESENYEMSILVRWNGNYEKFTLRKVILFFNFFLLICFN